MVVHELSHGVVAKAQRLPLKSVGLVLLAVIPPGAFVEPDEEELGKAPPLRARLRVYGAGSMANVVTALLTLLLINLAITPPLSSPPEFSSPESSRTVPRPAFSRRGTS